MAFMAAAFLLVGCAVEGRVDDMPTIVPLKAGDIEMLSKVVWAEARSESWEGQCAVVWVIINRLNREGGRFPKTIQGIIKQPYAFSCFNSNDPQCERVKVVNETDPAYLEAMRAVLAVVTGRMPDPVLGADHYHTVGMKHYPSWASKMPLVKRLGSHLFYRESR
jgi:spore germination cell wall hydrolase CwlJ-like protein